MTSKKYIIFDFDGTLVDSVDIAMSIYNRIAPRYNCKPVQNEAREILSSKNPQRFFKEYGITPFKLFLLVYTIRRELGKQIRLIEPVKGMEQTLRALHQYGYRLGILTSNSKKNVEEFLTHNHLRDLFSFVYSGRKLLGKDKAIAKLLEREGIDAKDVVYVGDETRDVLAMKKVLIPIVAVSWGLTSREKHSTLKPESLIDSPVELTSELINSLLTARMD